jgi:SAM-dependent methyltransferase
MDKNFEHKYHELEASHFWFKSRRNFILQLLKNTNRNSKVLDIGCSSGLLLKDLEKEGFKSENLYGIDISQKAIENCKANGLNNCFVMSGDAIDLNEAFDIMIASDCLEHIENDNLALDNWNKQLKAGGKLYVFVPAFNSLWSHHDEVNMHFRRYTSEHLNNLLRKNNFIIKASGYWNFTLFLPLFIFRKINQSFRKSTSKKTDGDLNNIGLFNTPLLRLLNLENKMLKRVKFPFGISTYAIAQK